MEGILNDADKFPFEIVQFKDSTGLPASEQLVSVVEKFDPVTLTVAPTCAEVGLNLIDGAGTVKLADAESPA